MTNTVPKFPAFTTRLLTVSDLNLLLPNPYNRALVPSTLQDLEKALQNGTFLADEPILVNCETGIILNGHHRIEAIKKYYAKHGIIPQVFLFFTNTPPENIVHLNQIGKRWGTDDYINFYAVDKPNQPANPHYVYLASATKEILAAQKKALISHRIIKTQIYLYLCGYSLSAYDGGGFKQAKDGFIIKGGVQIKLDKQYIIETLHYYKALESKNDFTVLLNERIIKHNVFTFLLTCLCYDLDMTNITEKIINNKSILKEIHNAAILKIQCFDILFKAIPKRQLGAWCNFSDMRNDYLKKLNQGMLKPLTL